MEKPDKPTPNECCGGGSCCPCVWDDYFEKLKRWQEYQKVTDLYDAQTKNDQQVNKN